MATRQSMVTRSSVQQVLVISLTDCGVWIDTDEPIICWREAA